VASCQSRCSLSWQSEPNLSNPAMRLPSWLSKPHFFASGLRAGATCCSTRRPGTRPGKRRAEQGQSPGAISLARARDCGLGQRASSEESCVLGIKSRLFRFGQPCLALRRKSRKKYGDTAASCQSPCSLSCPTCQITRRAYGLQTAMFENAKLPKAATPASWAAIATNQGGSGATDSAVANRAASDSARWKAPDCRRPAREPETSRNPRARAWLQNGV